MEKGKLTQLGIIIAVFFTILIGVVLTQTIGDTTSKASALGTITDDQFTASNTTCTQVTTGCINTITSVENATGAVTMGTGNYTLCRTSTANLDGIILNAGASYGGLTLGGKTLNATYTESADCTYVADSMSRSLLNMNTLWFAIAVLLVGIAGYMKIKEDYF